MHTQCHKICNMTQKLISKEKSVRDLLQTIEPKGIAEESMRQTVEVLLNLIEELQVKVKSLESENQQLRDENNRLKRTRRALRKTTHQRKKEKPQKSIPRAVKIRLLK
jgi:FtsZ-binding cell division protein ZapB